VNPEAATQPVLRLALPGIPTQCGVLAPRRRENYESRCKTRQPPELAYDLISNYPERGGTEMMTPEQERIDAASHAPACPAVVDGFPCNRNSGHWGDHAAGSTWPATNAEMICPWCKEDDHNRCTQRPPCLCQDSFHAPPKSPGYGTKEEQ